ncbi:MAG: SEC-C domain-containing protein [Clostridia bacterium]|nr:SEC-C domain-containing protein [Clostridia bacterium]
MTGSYVFSVSFGTGCYRHIRIAKRKTLRTFHKAITGAFGIPDGLMYAFFMNNCAWDNTAGYYGSAMPDVTNPTADEVRLVDFGLLKDSRFLYIYDFRQEKRFTVKLLKELPEDTEKPVVLRAKGEFLVESRTEPEHPLFEDVTAERNSLIDLYATAAVHLYGMLPVETFCKIFNSHGNEPLEEAEAAQTLQKFAGREYVIFEDKLVFAAGENVPALVEALEKQTAGKPRYVPNSKETFLEHTNMYYTDVPELMEQVHEFIAGVLKNKNEATLLLGEFMQMLRLDYPLQEFAGLLADYRSTPETREEGERFFALVIEAKNNSRIWANKGFTPRELAVLMRNAPKNIGRNDPCPCGSGKKYKKCCGK